MSSEKTEARVYGLAELRAVIDSLLVPASVFRAGIILAVNAKWLEAFPWPREEVEGAPFSNFTPVEDRERLKTRHDASQNAGFVKLDKLPNYVMQVPGRKVVVQPHVKAFAAEEGGHPYLLSVTMPVAETQRELDFGEVLARVSAGLVGKRTEAALRGATIHGFQEAGMKAQYLVGEGSAFRSTSGPVSGETARFAQKSLQEGRLMFVGIEEIHPSAVLLPLDVAGRELLQVEAPGELLLRSVSHLETFIQLYQEAIANLRWIRESERQNEELRVLAEFARMASEPQPATLEAFLTFIAEIARARAAVVRGPVGHTEQIFAHVGLPVPAGSEWTEEIADRPWQRLTFRLARGATLLGTLEIFRPESFTPESTRLLETLANLLVYVLEHRRLRESSARQLTETRLLLDFARTTAGTLETSSILDIACDFLVNLLDVTNSFVFLLEPNGNTLRVAAASAPVREVFRTIQVPVSGPSVAARTARERRPIGIEDMSRDPQSFDSALSTLFHSKAILGLPLLSRDELIGVVVVVDSRGPRPFSSELIELAQATIGQLALSISNARLYESLWRSYAELAATRAEMVKRERLAALGELSAVVAHEVRNPLGAIFNSVASLKRLLFSKRPVGPAAMEDASMLLEVLAEESERLDGMVGDLLDFTRPRELLLNAEPVPPLLQEALEAALHQPGISVGPVVFDTDFDPALPNVPMDRKLIRQALVNVTVNAVQAMPRGGRIRVKAAREVRERGEMLRIDITDEGPGIPAELQPRVFEPFFTTKAKGTGLGLAVVKRIMEEHHGEVSATSAPKGADGKSGTTFTLFLPLEAKTFESEAMRRVGGVKG